MRSLGNLHHRVAATSVVSDDAFEVESGYLLIGRTAEEYAAMFGLNEIQGPVLDCGAGVGSFVAETREKGIDVVGIDPAYARSRAALAERARADRAANVAQLRAKPDLFEWSFYDDLETRAGYLERASQRFLADYPAEPYVAGALPELPVHDDAVRLALSANLLFLYDDRLSLEFHTAALRELCRVASEVRIFPLASLDRTRSAHVEPCLKRLQAAGYDARLVEVDYEFQPGATTALVVD